LEEAMREAGCHWIGWSGAKARSLVWLWQISGVSRSAKEGLRRLVDQVDLTYSSKLNESATIAFESHNASRVVISRNDRRRENKEHTIIASIEKNDRPTGKSRLFPNILTSTIQNEPPTHVCHCEFTETFSIYNAKHRKKACLFCQRQKRNARVKWERRWLAIRGSQACKEWNGRFSSSH
jgi:hypothetical protein